MKRTTASGEIVKKYLDLFPTYPSRRIATLLYEKNKVMFKSVEEARRFIRYYRGAAGEARLDPIEFRPRQFVVPEGIEESYEPYIIPKEYTKVLLLADAHVPYHNEDALEMALEYGEKKGVQAILLDGDFCDFYQASFFSKDPSRASVKEELGVLNSILDMIQKALPSVKIIYKEGNHEERLARYVMDKAPALWGIPEIKLEALLNCKDRGIDYIGNKRVMKFNALHIIHGHEYRAGMSSPVNPARGLFLKARKHVIAGHEHRTSEHTENDISGEITSCFSVGCLCALNPEYMPLNRWNLGFAMLERDDRMFYVDNKRIVNYRIV